MGRVDWLGRPAPQAARLLLALGVTAWAGWQLLPWLLSDPLALIATGHLKDDAFFYSTLAERVLVEGFFSLDGVTETNGFQPLWMAILVCLKALIPDASSLGLLRGMSWFFYLTGCAGTVWLITQRATLFQALIRVVLVGGLVLLNRRFQDLVVEGLEVPLAMTLLVGTLCALPSLRRVLTAVEARPLGQVLAAAGVGVLGALVFFGRTDLFWLAGLLTLWVLRCSAGRPRLPMVAAVTTATLVMPYLAHNLLSQGSLVPVSGRVKVHFMEQFLQANDRSYWSSDEWHGPISLFQSWLPITDITFAAVILMAGLVACVVVLWRDRRAVQLPEGLTILACLAILHLIYMVFFYGEVRPYTNYYFVPEVLSVVITLACALSQLSARSSVLAVALYIVATSSASWGPLDMKSKRFWLDRIATAERLDDLASGGRVGAFWPGVFAELTDADVTPLDGVIGSNAYFESVIKPGDEVNFLRRAGIRYVVLAADGGALLGKRRVRAPLWSDLGRERIWEKRKEFRVVYQRGAWTILERISPPG